MSVSHPLIKELKGFVSKLHLYQQNKQKLTDSIEEVALFCDCFERILYKGLLPSPTYIYISKTLDCWSWIKSLADEKFGAPYSYISCVSSVLKSTKVSTTTGRVRLFIRYALMNKCIHVPLQILVNSQRQRSFYSINSLLGDPILIELTIAVLLFCSKLPFDLELKNARFLDETWRLPASRRVTFVPCKQLGIHIIFVSKVPVVVHIIPNSVADDEGSISVGDVLDEVNERSLVSSDRGYLSDFLACKSGPVTAHVLKGSSGGAVYPPLLSMLRTAGLDLSRVAAASLPSPHNAPQEEEGDCSVDYVGVEGTGQRGDVRQIHLAISRLLEKIGDGPHSQVIFSFYDLGLRIRLADQDNSQVMLEHCFMEISCCGSTTSVPQYFAYIAGDKDYVNCKNYKCYVFFSSNKPLVEKILRSIAQGFRRTMCTV